MVFDVIAMPTRITSRSATLTDHIYYFAGSNNKRDLKPRSGNLLSEITDHLPNYVIVLNNNKHSVLERPLVRVL